VAALKKISEKHLRPASSGSPTSESAVASGLTTETQFPHDQNRELLARKKLSSQGQLKQLKQAWLNGARYCLGLIIPESCE